LVQPLIDLDCDGRAAADLMTAIAALPEPALIWWQNQLQLRTKKATKLFSLVAF